MVPVIAGDASKEMPNVWQEFTPEKNHELTMSTCIALRMVYPVTVCDIAFKLETTNDTKW